MGLLLSILISYSCAAVSEKSSLAFNVDPRTLIEGEIQQFSALLPAENLEMEYPETEKLDALRLHKAGGKIGLAKNVFLVNRSVGFFSDQQFEDKAWLTRLGLADAKVFVDSDDLSNVQDYRIIHAMSETKKLDPASAGAFSSVAVVRKDELVLFNYMPLSGHLTLVVSYRLKRFPTNVSLAQWRKELQTEVPALMSQMQLR